MDLKKRKLLSVNDCMEAIDNIEIEFADDDFEIDEVIEIVADQIQSQLESRASINECLLSIELGKIQPKN